MNADLNSIIQRKLNKNKKSKNMKRLLLVLSLVAVIVTSTVLANPASALSEEASGDVVQGMESSGDAGVQDAGQADVQPAEVQAVAAAPEEQTADSTSTVKTLDAPQSAENGASESGNVSGAEIAAPAAGNDGSSATAGEGVSGTSAGNSADGKAAGQAGETAAAAEGNAAGTADSAGKGTTDGTAEGVTEDAAEAETIDAVTGSEEESSVTQIAFEDDRVKVTASFADGGTFTEGMALAGETLGSDDWNSVLSTVKSRIAEGNSSQTSEKTGSATGSSHSDAAASAGAVSGAANEANKTSKVTTTTTVEYSVAGLHALSLRAKNVDGSDTEAGGLSFSAEFKSGLNDAGYASKEEKTESESTGSENGVGSAATGATGSKEDGSRVLTTTTTRYETSWRAYLVSGGNFADAGSITDAEGTGLSADSAGALQSASFRGSLPQTVAFAQIVKKTVTVTTEERTADNAAEEVSMPPATFEQKVTTENGTVTVYVDAEEGTFEEGTAMTVTPVTSRDVLDKAINAAGGKGAAAAMDITFTNPDGTKTEPLKPIRVKMTSAVLNRADEAHVVHVTDTGSTAVVAKKSDGRTVESTSSEALAADAKNAVSFESGSFSVYAIVYTVDFTFSGYTYSIKGGSSIRLSSLAKKLGLHDTKQNKDFAIDDVDDVTFSNSSLVEVAKKDGDWELVSKKPFTSTEKLTISMKDGSKYEVEVKDAQGDQVDQGTTCEVYFLDDSGNRTSAISTESGEELNARIRLTNSSANTGDYSYVKVAIGGLGQYVTLKNDIETTPWDTITIEDNNTHKNIDIDVYFDETSNSVIYRVPAGATAIVPLDFKTNNGITPNNTEVTLTPEKCDENGRTIQPSGNDKIGTSATGTWTSTFQWDAIDKKVNGTDTNTISIDDSNPSSPKLTGDLLYTYSANSGNRSTSGMRWTDYAEVTDTVSLPEGVTLPENCVIDKGSGKITDSRGKTIWQLSLKPNMSITDIQVSDDRRSITYNLTINNENKNSQDNKLKGEIENLSWSGVLSADQLVLDTGYINKVISGNENNNISNNVVIHEYPIVGEEKPSSEDTVTTTPKYTSYQIKKTSTKEGQTLKPGDPVDYTVTVSNKSSAAITGDDSVILDTLPKALTLDKGEIDRLNNIEGVTVSKNGDDTYSIEYKKNIPAKDKIELKINAKVKDVKALKKENVSTDVLNTASYKDVSDTVISHLNYGYLSVVKTGDNKDEGGNIKETKNGETVHFTVTVQNETDYPADKDYKLTDTLPAYLQLQLYSDEQCQNPLSIDDVYNGQNVEKTDVYVKDSTGTGHKVNVTINADGTATITKNYNYTEGFPANTTKTLGYEVVFNASKASGANTDGEGNVYFQNVATLDDGTQGQSGFRGQTGKVNLSKEVTDAVLNGNHAGQPYEDQTIVSYTIHVKNDETNPKTGDIEVYDDLPNGLMPYGFKNDSGTEVNKFDDLVKLAKDGAVLKDKAGNKVTITYPADHFRLSWTISNADGKFKSADICYQAQVQQSKISDLNGETITLTNKATSGKTEASTDIKVKGNGIKIEKFVKDDQTNEWVKNIKVKPGATYTYKLVIHNPNHVDTVVKNVSDVLPYASKGLPKSYWNSQTVVVNNSGDFITHAVDTQYPYPYEINDGSILFRDVHVSNTQDDLTQTITLKWPDSEALSEWYGKTKTEPWYSSSENILYADGMEDHVEHKPDVEKKYYLQKSVIALNYGDEGPISGKTSFKQDKLKFVEYGVVFANTGKSSLHLTELTDILPAELDYYTITDTDWNKGAKPSGISNEITTQWQGNTCFILPDEYSVFSGQKITASQNKQTVSFSINKGQGVDLAPKQVIAFNIWCKVKDGAASTMKENEPITNAIRAEVDKDAELNPVLISTTRTPYDDFQNNGSCTEINTGDTTKTAESTVTIYPINMPIPGIQKTAVKYRELLDSKVENWSEWADLSADHSQNISSQCQIEWKIRLYNDGTVPITNYTFRDKLINKHQFVPATATWKLGSKSWEEDKIINLDVSASKEENRDLYVAVWNAQGDQYTIPAGDYAEITVITQYTSAGFQGQLTNEAYFEPQQECDYNGVQRGQLEKSADGSQYIGVSSGDYVNMYGDGATISYKQVTEEDDSSNTAYGYDISTGHNFIMISDKLDTFRYTASVTNVSKRSLYSYTMIDTLPAPNDTGVVNASEQRDSEYTITLSENPNFVIVLTGKDSNGQTKEITLDKDDYQLNYSDKTTFTIADWAGDESDAWEIAKPETAKSFRVILKPDKVVKKLVDVGVSTSNAVLPSKWNLKVSFTCTAGEGAAPGDIAWNSFGYRYAYLNDLKDPGSYLTAEPPKVGVKIPAEPIIKKVVEDSKGKVLGEDKTVSFTFKIYKGEVTPETTKEELTKNLIETVSVTQGGYYELKPKAKVNGVEQGFYEEGQKYTVIEDNANGYKTSRFEVNGVTQTQNKSYCTFTYQRNSSFNIRCVNREEQSFALPSTGGPGDLPWVAPGMLLMLLAGTVFAVRKLLIYRSKGKGGGLRS